MHSASNALQYSNIRNQLLMNNSSTAPILSLFECACMKPSVVMYIMISHLYHMLVLNY